MWKIFRFYHHKYDIYTEVFCVVVLTIWRNILPPYSAKILHGVTYKITIYTDIAMKTSSTCHTSLKFLKCSHIRNC
jgi:hypothetical protein